MSFAVRIILVLVCYAICIGGLIAVVTERSEPRRMPRKSIPVRYDQTTNRIWLRV